MEKIIIHFHLSLCEYFAGKLKTHFILQILCVGYNAPSDALTMKRLVKLHRNFSTSNYLLGWRDKIVFEDDWNKRPSDVEIRKKGLPQNDTQSFKK